MKRLYCTFQNYDWGRIGAESEVYNLIKDSNTKLDASKPYAELWMGTHSSGPSFLDEAREKPLSTFISKFPRCLGSDSRKRFGRNLPFLFKVLSVRKALSIQAHPTKHHAVELHRNRPDLYKDSNHKPEMAIALTPFEALLAFRPVNEIAWFVQNIPELLEIVGVDCCSDLCTAAKSVLPDADVTMAAVATKTAYTRLMQADQVEVEKKVEDLRKRLLVDSQTTIPLCDCQSSESGNNNTDLVESVDLAVLSQLFIRLSEEYPGDVGCFSIFFLNYVKLEPGQAVFLEANLPHAYLSGDCVECMACSDNVVRAGLTPKFKDVDCLISMLKYEPRTVDSLLFPGTPRLLTGCRWSFAKVNEEEGEEGDPEVPTFSSYFPPVDEFGVDRIALPRNSTALELLALPSASVLIVIQGQGYLQRLGGGGGHTARPGHHHRGQSRGQQETTRDQVVVSSDKSVVAVDDDDGGADDSGEEFGEDNSEAVSKLGALPAPGPNGQQEATMVVAGRFHQILPFHRGSVFFINAGVSFCIHPEPVTSAPALLAFRAYANVEPVSESQTL